MPTSGLNTQLSYTNLISVATQFASSALYRPSSFKKHAVLEFGHRTRRSTDAHVLHCWPADGADIGSAHSAVVFKPYVCATQLASSDSIARFQIEKHVSLEFGYRTRRSTATHSFTVGRPMMPTWGLNTRLSYSNLRSVAAYRCTPHG